MKQIVLISCSKSKLSFKAMAQDLYTGTIFKYSMQYAKSLKPDNIYILSAKYGLVPLDDIIVPYDKTLYSMSSIDRKDWSSRVLNQLEKQVDLGKNHFIILAGEIYRKYLVMQFETQSVSFEIPLKGMNRGKQLRYLKKANE